MNLILFDDPGIRAALLPFTFTRPVAEIRIGILRITEKWSKRLGSNASFLTQPHLQTKFPLKKEEDNLLINGAVCPDEKLLEAIEELALGHCLYYNDVLIAARQKEASFTGIDSLHRKEYSDEIVVIDAPWKIFQGNARQVREDFTLVTHGRTSVKIEDPHLVFYGANEVFIEEGAQLKATVIDTTKGPVYIGKNVQIDPGALINGNTAICEGSHLRMATRILGDSTIGPWCKIGGEIGNSVIFGLSNKAHDGYLGNTVIGEWCNLGADTNASNLKNNYGSVKIWNYPSRNFKDTGQTFCGLMMGDHSKCGINTMFNTGTVVGVSCNIFGAGFPKTFIPSFSWGGPQGFVTYQLNKALETTQRVMDRRGDYFNDQERDILTKVFEETATFRNWEEKTSNAI